MAGKTRAELTRLVASLQNDVHRLTALVYINRKFITNSEYIRTQNPFSYVPAQTAIVRKSLVTAPNLQGNMRTRPASDFTIPSIETMYRHVMTNVVLDLEENA